MTDRYSTWDAAYVLGALPACDRREYEDHLRECSRCAEAVDHLRPLTPLLDLVDERTALGLLGDSSDAGPGQRCGT